MHHRRPEVGDLLGITAVARWLWPAGGGVGKRQLRRRGVRGNGRRLSLGTCQWSPLIGKCLAHSPAQRRRSAHVCWVALKGTWQLPRNRWVTQGYVIQSEGFGAKEQALWGWTDQLAQEEQTEQRWMGGEKGGGSFAATFTICSSIDWNFQHFKAVWSPVGEMSPHLRF